MAIEWLLSVYCMLGEKGATWSAGPPLWAVGIQTCCCAHHWTRAQAQSPVGSVAHQTAPAWLPLLVVASALVPGSPVDVAEGRHNFEQPFSFFGQPGPRLNENLESIDGSKNRENKNHKNFANGIANPDSKTAQQERQEAELPYMRIFSK